jgi:hypothetical protein
MELKRLLNERFGDACEYARERVRSVLSTTGLREDDR